MHKVYIMWLLEMKADQLTCAGTCWMPSTNVFVATANTHIRPPTWASTTCSTPTHSPHTPHTPPLFRRLDSHGHSQAAKLHKAFVKSGVKLDVVLVSPMTRTLETAAIVFPKANMAAIECIREAFGSHPCDKRQDVSHYAKAFPSVNFTLVWTGERGCEMVPLDSPSNSPR